MIIHRAKKLFAYSTLGGETVVHSSSSGMHMSELNHASNNRRRTYILGTIVIILLTFLILLLLTRRGGSSNVKTVVSSVEKFQDDNGDQQEMQEMDDKSDEKEENEDEKRRIGNMNENLDYDDQGPQRVTLQEFVEFELAADNQYALNATWLDDQTLLYRDRDLGLVSLNVLDNSKQVIMSGRKLRYFRVYEFWLSPDKSFLMLKTRSRRVFRHSALSIYKILPLKKGRADATLIELRPNDKKKDNKFKHRSETRLRYASFGPVGNALVFVDADNNVYYRSEVMGLDEQLSRDGNESSLFNGVPDWVFEEEVMESDHALYWAPDARKIVYGRFDDTDVNEVFLKNYGSLKPSLLSQYPEFSGIKYPKTDSNNPRVSLFLADASGGREGEISVRELNKPQQWLPKFGDADEIFFSQVKWVDSTRFLVQWLNRVQNETIISLCSAGMLENCRSLFHYQEKGGWVQAKLQILVDPKAKDSKDEPDFVVVLGNPATPARYRQLLLVSGGERIWLTSSLSDISELKLWSSSNHIFFTASMPSRPGTRQLFRVKVNKRASPECISCNLHTLVNAEDPCLYVIVLMSPGGENAALTCSGPDIPYSLLVSLEETQLKLLSVFDSNADLADFLETKALPDIKMIDVPLSFGPTPARVKLYTPPEMDRNKKYPLLINAYGGPNSQYVDEQFNQHDYQTFLTTSHHFVYAVVDPVGTADQGDTFRFGTYHKFGGPEVDSVLEVAQYLKKELEYVDETKCAIWGWSYGGFLAIMALARGKEVFGCGAAVAPVVDWSLYDTVYTERYMGHTFENVQGYNSSKAYWYLEGLRDKPFYLLHGTKDDNVHFQQSMLLSAALEKRDILFRQQAYPDQSHSIFDFLRHLYHSLTDFFVNECFRNRTRIAEEFQENFY